MNERVEAKPAEVVRSGSAALWLDSPPDQSEDFCVFVQQQRSKPTEAAAMAPVWASGWRAH